MVFTVNTHDRIFTANHSSPAHLSPAKLAYVAGVKRGRGRGNLGAGEKGRKRVQEDHCFLHFSRSDSERENSDWSELIKCQSST